MKTDIQRRNKAESNQEYIQRKTHCLNEKSTNLASLSSMHTHICNQKLHKTSRRSKSCLDYKEFSLILCFKKLYFLIFVFCSFDCIVVKLMDYSEINSMLVVFSMKYYLEELILFEFYVSDYLIE